MRTGETVVKRVIALLVVGAAVGATFGAAPASATLAFPFDGQLAPSIGSFGTLENNSVAVNDANNDVYVADFEAGAVDVFDSLGAEVERLDGSSTPAGSFGGGEGRIYVAANDTSRDVYVLDSVHRAVDEFNAAGAYICQITGNTTPSASECNGVAGSATPGGEFASGSGLAVDQTTGDIYVLDVVGGGVDVFTAGGAFERQVSLSGAPMEVSAQFTRGLSVGGAGHDVFVGEGLQTVVLEFDGSGAFVTTLTGENTPGGHFRGEAPGTAIDDATGRLFVTDREWTDVFNSEGAYVTRFSHDYHFPSGTAFDPATGRVYVSDDASPPTPQTVDIFGSGAVIPTVETKEPTGIQPTQAVLEGSVNPEGLQVTDCHFEWGPEGELVHSVPCEPAAATLPADSTEHAVEATIAGLEAGHAYQYRISASNANGIANVGSTISFETPPKPRIDHVEAVNLTGEAAELTAEINPRGFESTYEFEWGTSTAYGHVTAGKQLPAGQGDNRASENITGLMPNKIYHWRVVATSANGTAVSADHTFNYLIGSHEAGCPNEGAREGSSSSLPDCRAYELVSPPDKNGSLLGVGFILTPPDVAADGSRMIVTSIQCLEGTPSCTGARQNEGEPYMFARTAGGWRTTPLAPPVLPEDANSNWAVSATDGTALFSFPSPPGEQDDFVVREASGTLAHLGPATPPALGPIGPTSFDGNRMTWTEDFKHVVFEAAQRVWEFDESAGRTLYQLNGVGNTAPELVGVSGGHGDNTLISKCGTELATGGLSRVEVHPMSADGSVVAFTAVGHDTTECAAGVSAPPVDELYARLHSSTTVPISGATSSECVTPECSNSAPGAAKFEDMSKDGRQILFVDTQKLTDSASEDATEGDTARGGACKETTGANGCNLYEYDFDRPAGRNLIDISAGDTSGRGPEVQRVAAISSDGSHVYFIARGVLSSGPNSVGASAVPGGENLYMYAGGRVTFIATLSTEDLGLATTGTLPPSLTPDGRYLVFVSRADLTPDDTSTSGATQVFRYDAATEQLTRISVGRDGFNDNGNTQDKEPCLLESCPADAAIAVPLDNSRRDPTMSDDGSYIFFQSPVGLTPSALNDVRIGTTDRGVPVLAQNVYEYHEGVVSLISDGKDTADVARANSHKFGAVELVGADTTGANVFFTTADPLTPVDHDTQVDYYDARIDGGFSYPREGHGCESNDECHGGPGEVAAAATPASTGVTGIGNLKPDFAAPSAPRKVTRAQRLAKSLKACKTIKRKRKRQRCVALARKKYGPTHTRTAKRGTRK